MDPDTRFRYTQEQYEAALARERAEEQNMEVEVDNNGDIIESGGPIGPVDEDLPDLMDDALPEMPQLVAPPGHRGPRPVTGRKRPADEISPDEGDPGKSFINLLRRWQTKMLKWNNNV